MVSSSSNNNNRCPRSAPTIESHIAAARSSSSNSTQQQQQQVQQLASGGESGYNSQQNMSGVADVGYASASSGTAANSENFKVGQSIELYAYSGFLFRFSEIMGNAKFKSVNLG